MIMYFMLGKIMLRFEEHHSDKAPHGIETSFSSKTEIGGQGEGFG